MTYATKQTMIDQFGEDDLMRLTDRTGADVIDDDRLQSAIDDAVAEVNGYIRKRVTLPLDPVPRILETHTRRIAYYNLFDQRGTEDIPEPRKRYEAAIRFLKSVANGEVSLGDETPGDGTDASPGPVCTEAPARDMTRDSLKGF